MKLLQQVQDMKRSLLGIVLFLIASLLFAACTGVNGVPEPPNVSDSSVEQGRQLIASYGCGSCHTITGIPGADSIVGPPLDNYYQRTYIVGRIPNTWDNLIAWIQNPQHFEPGSAMPNLGVSETDANQITAYLYHRQNLLDVFRR